MITVTARAGGIDIKGHARAAPKGSDIVCAAVSALWQTLIKSLEDLTEDKIEYGLKGGESHLEFEELSGTGKVLVSSFFTGIRGVAESYPDNVKFITAGVEPKRGSADKATDKASGDEIKGGQRKHEQA